MLDVPLSFLLATFGGLINRQQAKAIEFLVEENRVLREQLGDQRVRLDDGQRRQTQRLHPDFIRHSLPPARIAVMDPQNLVRDFLLDDGQPESRDLQVPPTDPPAPRHWLSVLFLMRASLAAEAVVEANGWHGERDADRQQRRPA